MSWLLTSMTYFSTVFNQLWTYTVMILSGKHSLSVSGMACWSVLLTSCIHLTTEGINLSWQATLYIFKAGPLFLQSAYGNSAWLSITVLLEDIFLSWGHLWIFLSVFHLKHQIQGSFWSCLSTRSQSIFTQSFNWTRKRNPAWLVWGDLLRLWLRHKGQAVAHPLLPQLAP